MNWRRNVEAAWNGTSSISNFNPSQQIGNRVEPPEFGILLLVLIDDFDLHFGGDNWFYELSHNSHTITLCFEMSMKILVQLAWDGSQDLGLC